MGISTDYHSVGEYWMAIVDDGSTVTGLNNDALDEADTEFDIESHDVMIQLDIFDGTGSFWAWLPDEPMPTEPLGTWEDDTLRSGTVSLWINDLDGGEVTGAFRFIEVADAPSPTRRLAISTATDPLNSSDIDLLRARSDRRPTTFAST